TCGQPAAGERIVLLIEAPRKLGTIAQHSGHRERQDTPKIQQAVLDGRARERQSMSSLERTGGLRGLRVRVLDGLGLVQDGGLPATLGYLQLQNAELRVI